MPRALWYLFFIALLALGGAGYYWLGSGKEQIRNVTAGVAAKGEIEKTAAEAVQAEVDVKGVSLALQEAEGSVEGVTIENPKGFSDEPAMQLGAVKFELDRRALDGTGPLVIRSLSINAADIRYDRGEKGNSNLEALAATVAEAAEKALADKEAKAAGRPVIIDNLYVRNIRLRIGDVAEGTELKRLHLSNIGRMENGVPPTAAAQTILLAIAKAADAAGKQALAQAPQGSADYPSTSGP